MSKPSAFTVPPPLHRSWSEKDSNLQIPASSRRAGHRDVEPRTRCGDDLDGSSERAHRRRLGCLRTRARAAPTRRKRISHQAQDVNRENVVDCHAGAMSSRDARLRLGVGTNAFMARWKNVPHVVVSDGVRRPPRIPIGPPSGTSLLSRMCRLASISSGRRWCSRHWLQWLAVAKRRIASSRPSSATMHCSE